VKNEPTPGIKPPERITLPQGAAVAGATKTKPSLSVVITTYNAVDTVEVCLESLRCQATAERFEIILVDSSTDGTADLVNQKYPEVRLVRSQCRLYCGSARNRGIALAQADVIAFMDADCYVEPSWIDAVMAAHRSDYLALGGTIENGTRGSLVAWAYYFCEFNLWLPAKARREISEMAGCCLSIKRAAFDKYGPFVENTYSSDTAFQWKLTEDGHRVLCCPSIRVFHMTPLGFWSYVHHVAEHRCQYAQVRVRERRMGMLARLGSVVLTPILPLLLLGAITLRVLHSPSHVGRLIACSPVLMAGLCARAWGEAQGFLR
jgi:cellulose synthase/poly-beta-1,6-N-acetylglucosamine synthase-like glycosyltransferase